MEYYIAPSLLSADFGRLAEEVRAVEKAGADLLHVDVMDGRFVPNLTIGPPVVAALRGATRLPLDCHLMIENADRWIDAFADAGAARITVHAEACPHLHRTIQAIRARGAQAGAAINPATPVDALAEIVADLDVVLVMSVNPGFGGQTFIPHALDKIRRVAALARARGVAPAIQVDGGVGPKNAGEVVAAGATSLVAGNAVFGADDPAEAVRALRRVAERRA
jgi:ribulose-phosphate 3-epimerase